MLIIFIILLIFSSVILVKTSDWVIHALVGIAKAFGWSEYFITFCLMAVAASLPELFVGITSALNRQSQLSFGNIIGANVINLTLIVGLAAIIGGNLPLHKTAGKRDAFWAAIFAFLPTFLILDGALSRVDGVVLLAIAVIYSSYFLKGRTKAAAILSAKIERSILQTKMLFKDIAIFVVGVILLLLSAQGIVWSSTVLAETIGAPVFLIGILVVAVGTTLPEMAFGLRAVMLNHKDMVLGNLMGSVIVTSTLVLGITCLIYPLNVIEFSPYTISIIFIIISAFLFYIFTRTREVVSKKEGVILIITYCIFVISQILV